MGRRVKKGRLINGVVLLDKPAGITSNAALQIVKRLFDARKAGHTGSLDPLATGMLPLCLGEATKVSSFLLDADKRYRTTVKLGVKTNTGDAEGDVISTRPVTGVTFRHIENILLGFNGPIEQTPPMHSAIKINGVPLYKLAHKGIEIERQPRTVTIHKIELTGFEGDELRLDIHCSKGTYIRVLAEDIGEMLGCGAHVQALHRYEVGPFKEENIVTLDTLEMLAEQGLERLDEILLPTEYAVSDWPEVNLSEDAAYYLSQGQAVFVPRTVSEGWVKLMTDSNHFLGVGQIMDDGKVAPRKLFNLM